MADFPDPPSESPPPPERILEAMLFVGGGPLDLTRAHEWMRGVTTAQAEEAVAGLAVLYRRQNRPYAVRKTAEGYELVLHPAMRAVAARMRGTAKATRLTQPALDVLAIVAYRQPVTRTDIETARGGESLGLVRQLLRLGLVSVQGEGGESREPAYGTTARFLAEFGLRDLEDLPRLAE